MWVSLADRSSNQKRWITGLALVGILLLGWHVRFDNFHQWKEHSETFFIHGEPVLTNSDGYFYLRQARELVAGEYGRVDEKRNVPDHPSRPILPPLLSCLTAATHQITGLSLNWIAIVLPTILGPLCAIPVVLLAGALGGGLLMQLSAALITVLGIALVDRTRVGYFDTDSLNVLLTLLSSYFALRLATAAARQRYLYFAASLLNYALLLWWWDQVPEFVTFVCLSPILLALVLLMRKEPQRRRTFYGIGVLTLFAMFFGLGAMSEIPIQLGQLVNMVTGKQAGSFPTVEIAELQPASWSALVQSTTGQAVFLILSVVGLIGLAIDKRHRMVFLVVPGVMALFPVFAGIRFIIFTIPFVGLGLGYAFEASLTWASAHSAAKWRPVLLLGMLGLIVVATLPAYNKSISVFRGPITRRTADGIEAIGKFTEEDAVIWSTWTVGYALTDRTGRSTIIDGQAVLGESRYYANLPLAQGSQQFAANFIQFYIHRGVEGIHQLMTAFDDRPDETMDFIKAVLSVSPQQARGIVEKQAATIAGLFASTQECLRFLFPAHDRPVYLLLHREQIDLSGWFYFGSWDLTRRQGTHVLALPYFGVRQRGGKIHLDAQQTIDLETGGSFLVSTRDIPEQRASLAHLFEFDGKTPHITHFEAPGSLAFEWIVPMGFGVLMSKELSESVFNQLFLRYQGDSSYFQFVQLKTPRFQIWRVVGDRL